jgi:hypothetical protein
MGDNVQRFKVIIRIQAQSQKYLQSIFNELTNQLRDKVRLIHPVKPLRLMKLPTTQILQHYFLGGKNGSGKNSSGYH